MRPGASSDVAIIGAGIAGLAAAAQCVSRGASVALLESDGLHGGLVFNVGALDDYPAPGALSGAALGQALLERVQAAGARVLDARATAIEPTGRSLRVSVAAGDPIVARAVIVASGGRLRRLGVPGEEALAGRGVSQCDWCDAGFFRDEAVAVVGAGDSALQAALHLARTSSRVTVIVRGSEPRARRAYLERAADEPRIEFLWDTRVVAIEGADRVESLRLESDDPAAPERLPVSGVFVFVGLEPQTGFVPSGVERDEHGRLRTDAGFETRVPGLYAIGAVRSGHSGGLSAAIGEGAGAAALACERVLRDG